MRLLTIILAVIILSQLFVNPAFATEASLKCSPSTGTYKVGETFEVEYVLDTRTFEAYGADIEATYDGDIIETVGSQSTAITAVTGWGQPTTNLINASSALISLDFGKAQSAYKGSTTIGKVMFKGKSAGQAQLNYNFFQQYDDTTPGVAKVWGKKNGTDISNILTDVNNCIFIIEAQTPIATPTAPPVGNLPTSGPTSPPSPTISVIPPLGGENTTISLLGISAVLIGTGIFLPYVLSKREV